MASRFETVFNAAPMAGIERLFGVVVCLARGPLRTAEFTARRDDFENVAMGQEIGLNYKIERRKYYLPVASIVMDDETAKPRAGDVVTEGALEWRIFFPDDSTPAVERTAGGHDWIVHTQLVEDE